MNAVVISQNVSTAMCSARTQNDVLVVFRLPPGARIDVGDVLDLDLFVLDQIQHVENLTKHERIAIEVRSDDVHELRLPSAHGVSRFPSDDRRKSA